MKDAHDAHQAAPWGLTGYFLDPDLFRLLAHSARLQLPEQPLHTPRWRQTGCLTFHMQLSHALRSGICNLSRRGVACSTRRRLGCPCAGA